jgi:uncharacterized protein YkwD
MSASARFRYLLAGAATAVVIGTGFTVVGLNKHADAVASNRPAADAKLAADGTGTGASTGVSTTGGAGPDASTGVTPTPSASSSPTPKATTSKAATSKAATKAPATKRPTTKATTKKTTAPVSSSSSVISQVLAHINAARADAGLKALQLSTALSKASSLHNSLMINGCGLSHQCSGESGIGDRFSAQGVKWSSAGENIGYGSSGSSTADIAKAANGLTDSMLAEKAPNDGHRKNLLNTGYTTIGLSVVRDSKGVTWMVQDFVG